HRCRCWMTHLADQYSLRSVDSSQGWCLSPRRLVFAIIASTAARESATVGRINPPSNNQLVLISHPSIHPNKCLDVPGSNSERLFDDWPTRREMFSASIFSL